jgi:hypothetical protein
MPRLRFVTANEQCRQGQIFIYDFERMYDGFVHHDIKLQLTQLISMCFSYQAGHAVLPEIGKHGRRQGICKRSGALDAIDITYCRRNKGIAKVRSAEWVNTTATAQQTGVLRLTSDALISMLTYCIDTAFVSHNGQVYQQVVGIGLHASPQIAQLVCANYELHFVKRLAIHHIERPETTLFDITDQSIRTAAINCFFNGARQLDDICLAGLPLSADHVTRILCKSGNDGVYPETVRDECGAIIQTQCQSNWSDLATNALFQTWT